MIEAPSFFALASKPEAHKHKLVYERGLNWCEAEYINGFRSVVYCKECLARFYIKQDGIPNDLSFLYK